MGDIMKNKIGFTKKDSTIHMHQNYEINICTEGGGTFCVDNLKTRFTAGQIFIIPPGTEHKFIHDDNTSRIFINGEFNHSFNFSSPEILSLKPNNEGQILAEMIYRNHFEHHEYLSLLINALIGFVLNNTETDNEIHATIKEIMHIISEQFFDSNLNVCEILNKSGYAEDYIRAQFKAVTGKTPVEFLSHIRISQACLLIDIYKDSLSLNEISERCGFTDYSYFSRRFKKIMGVSPRRYAYQKD